MGTNRALFSLLLKLPQFLKGPILRNVVEYPSDISSTLRFKVAETKEELSQAFTLLHDAYVAEKLMEPHPSGMRVTKYHSLPSTTTLIALENDVVVGTVSLIRQSSFGLPLESIFNIENVPAGSRLAEVSSLAIRKDRLHQRGRILFPLLKYLYHYCHDYFGVSHLVIAVNPKWIDFYRSILLFEPLSQKVVENYSFVNGAPAVGGILDLNLAQKLYYKVYSSKQIKRNLYSFFQDLDSKNMELPLRKKSLISDPVLSPKLLEYFFTEATDCLQNMTERELAVLRELYNHPDYLKLIPAPKVLPFQKGREQKRFETQLHGRWQRSDQLSSRLIVQSVSVDGIGGVLNDNSSSTEGLQKILVNIEENEPCELTGHFVWVAASGHFGFQISQSCDRWLRFVDSLDSRLFRPNEKSESSGSLRTTKTS